MLYIVNYNKIFNSKLLIFKIKTFSLIYKIKNYKIKNCVPSIYELNIFDKYLATTKTMLILYLDMIECQHAKED